MLNVVGTALDEALIAAWRLRVERAVANLGWARTQTCARSHLGGTLLAMAAPCDQLFLATEVNEWALCATLAAHDPMRWCDLERDLIAAALQSVKDGDDPGASRPAPPPVLDDSAALARFAVLASREANPTLRALLDAAASRGLSHVLDESTLSLGAGAGSQTFATTALPAVADVDWRTLHDIPTAIVTGSNGKTTTVRLLAACARAHGWHAAYSCTDGVYLDAEQLAAGDYSGPAGSRWVMREPRADAAILETARGGILRRGIAVSQAHAAIITNVSPDHFGEYGIDDLGGVTAVKFVVAAAVASSGLLVLNADDPQLRAQADGLRQRFGHSPPVGWFSVNPDVSWLHVRRDRGSPTCSAFAGHLTLNYAGVEHDLGPVAAMPLSMNGSATYNVANIAGTALVAAALGIAPATIAKVLAQFGAHLDDNPGRMMRFERRGVTVLVDYAHNADGLRGFLAVAARLRGTSGRLGMVLGQAGNRKDADIEDLARVVGTFTPDLVVVKENETQLRDRAPREVPRILRAALEQAGMSPSALPLADSEIAAVQHALEWAQPGDVLALPIHSSAARTAVVALLRQQINT